MPLASKVGFSPALYDIILQSEVWEEGWALLSEIGGGPNFSPRAADLSAPSRRVRLRLA
jgi:hypothetical protein